MSSGAAEAGEFDLNRDSEAAVDQLGGGSEKGLEDASVNSGGELIVEEEEESMTDCEREEGGGVADREDELLGNKIVGGGSAHRGATAENSEMNEMERGNLVGVVESRDGNLLEVGVREKGSSEQDVVSAKGYESAEVGNQDTGLEGEIADDERRGSDVDANEGSVTASVPVGSSNVADEHFKAEEDTIDPSHIEGAESDTMEKVTIVGDIDSKDEGTTNPTHVEGAGSDTVGNDTLVVSEIGSKGEDTIDPTHLEGAEGHDTLVISEIKGKGEDNIDPTHLEGAESDTVGHDNLIVSKMGSKSKDTNDPTHFEGAGSDTVVHDTLVVSEINSKDEDNIDPTHLECSRIDTVGHDTIVVSEIGSKDKNNIDPTHLNGAGGDTVGLDTIVVSEIGSKGEDNIDPTLLEGAGFDTLGDDTLVVSEAGSTGEDTNDPTRLDGAGGDTLGHSTFVSEVGSEGEGTIDPMHLDDCGDDTGGYDNVVCEISKEHEDTVDLMHLCGAGSVTAGHDTLVVNEVNKCEDAVDPMHVEGSVCDKVEHDTHLVSKIDSEGEDIADLTHPEGAGSDRMEHHTIIREINSKCDDTISPTHVEGAINDTVGYDTRLVGDVNSKCEDKANPTFVEGAGTDAVGHDTFLTGEVDSKCEDAIGYTHGEGTGSDTVGHNILLVTEIDSKDEDAIGYTHGDGAGSATVGHDTLLVTEINSKGFDPRDGVGADQISVSYVGINGGAEVPDIAKLGSEAKNSDCVHVEDKDMSNGAQFNESDDFACDFIEDRFEDAGNDAVTQAAAAAAADPVECVGVKRVEFIVGATGDQSEKGLKNDELCSNATLGKEILIKNGLEELDYIGGDLGAKVREEISDGNQQQEVVSHHNHADVVLRTPEGSEVDLAGGETCIGHDLVMDTEKTEDSTQALSIEKESKLREEDVYVACETVQRADDIAIAEEHMDTVCEMVEGNPVANDDGKEAEMDTKLITGSALLVKKGLESVGNAIETKIVTSEENEDIISGTIQGSAQSMENQTVLSQGVETECQEIQPSDVSATEQELAKRLEGECGLSASGYSEDIGFQSQKSGKDEVFDESDKQIQEQDSSKANSASTIQRATYSLSIEENEGFSISDLVWGKVKSHPWWPGQIIDFSDASELAFKYQKKDHFLVAYFGDKTFAWCEESNLKPFELYFSQMEKQSSSDSFLRGMADILAEVSRRIELGMVCSCIPEDTYTDLKYQKIENAGIRGKTISTAVDVYQVVNFFQPEKLLAYITALAQIPTGGADRLELAVALAQLKAFYHSRGSTELPTFTVGSGLVENDFEVPSTVVKSLEKDDLEQSATLADLFSAKGKSRGRDGSIIKEKLIADNGRKQQADEDLNSSGKKRKDMESDFTDIGISKTKKLDSLADKETKVPTPTSSISFKVGEFISRAATKLTSGQLSRKCHLESSEKRLSKIDDRGIHDMDIDDFLDTPFDSPKPQVDISEDSSSMNEMLSKLYLAAREPMKGYDSLSTVISFVTSFRNSCISSTPIENNNSEKPRAKRGRKKKINPDSASPDMSTPDHMKDSYWSDMIFPENDAVKIPKKRGRKRKKPAAELSPSLMLDPPSDAEIKMHIGAMCPHVKHILAAERPIISVEEKIVDERTPTAVILYFNSPNSLPSETDLIRIFSRYGPLKEADTYIEMKTNSAKVVFKKRVDAEMAFSSAGKFSNFGPSLVSYRLRYLPSRSSLENSVEDENDDASIRSTSFGISADSGTVAASDDKTAEALGGDVSNIERASGTPSGEGAAKVSSDFFLIETNTGIISDRTQVEDMGQECFKISLDEDEDEASMDLDPTECVDRGSEYFVQTQGTGVVSEQMLLESEDQELSYFDLIHSECGAVSGNVHVKAVNQDSSCYLLSSAEALKAADTKESLDPAVEEVKSSDNKQVEAVNQDSSCYLLDSAETIKAADAEESLDPAVEEVKPADNMQVEAVNQDSSGYLIETAETGELAQAIEFEADSKESFDPAAEGAKGSGNMQAETVIPDSSNCILDQAEELAHDVEFESDGQEYLDRAAGEIRTATGFESTREVSSFTPRTEANNLGFQDDNALHQPGLNECSESAPAHAGTGTSAVEDIGQEVSTFDTSVITDEKSLDDKLSNFDQENVDSGKDSGSGAVLTAEEPSVSVAFGEEMSISSDPAEGSDQKVSDSTCVESAGKDSYDPVPSEMSTGFVSGVPDVEIKVQDSSNFDLAKPTLENNTTRADNIVEESCFPAVQEEGASFG
ncbi:Serine/threonine-protein kinase ATM [Apostasia shenzhenica]|uniref:Serine/threonine-protein kinase ATM n=1 Tax=Apostasia shenzhenica TaxID=1088818 RepID=A0A2I0A8P6_9ASPA|nr:Serine/threonine-protein kinase ATM [Apostasia shenzhenica]